jgi:hypothetical protein
MWKMPSVRAGIDPRFDGIIDRAMQPEPADRFGSSVELRRELALIQAVPAGPGPAAARTRSRRRGWDFCVRR